MRLAILLNYAGRQTDFLKWSMYDQAIEIFDVEIVVKPMKNKGGHHA